MTNTAKTIAAFFAVFGALALALLGPRFADAQAAGLDVDPADWTHISTSCDTNTAGIPGNLSGVTSDSMGNIYGVANGAGSIFKIGGTISNQTASKVGDPDSVLSGYDTEGIAWVDSEFAPANSANFLAVAWESDPDNTVESGMTIVELVTTNAATNVVEIAEVSLLGISNGAGNKGLEGLAFASTESTSSRWVFYGVRETPAQLHRIVYTVASKTATTTLQGSLALDDAAGIIIDPGDPTRGFVLNESGMTEVTEVRLADGTSVASAESLNPQSGGCFTQAEGITAEPGSDGTMNLVIVGEPSEVSRFSVDSAICCTPLPTAVPTATPPPVSTATPGPAATATPQPTATATPHPIATATPRPTATATPPRPTATATPRPPATATPPPTATPQPTATATPRPTSTPQPTATATPRATATPPLPTATATPLPTATATPLPTATATPRPTATATPQSTATPLPTSTPVPAAVSTTAFVSLGSPTWHSSADGHSIASNSAGETAYVGLKANGDLFVRRALDGLVPTSWQRQGSGNWTAADIAIGEGGHIEIVAVKADGRLFTRSWSTSGHFSSWTRHGLATWDSSVKPSITVNGFRVAIGAVKTDGRLYTRERLGFAAWGAAVEHGQSNWSQVDVDLDTSGSLWLVGSKADGRLITRSRAGQQWGSFSTHGLANWDPTIAPSITASGPKVVLGAIKSNGQMYTRSYTGSAWDPFLRHGNQAWAAVSLDGDRSGRIALAATKDFGRLHTRWFGGSIWGSWVTQGRDTWSNTSAPAIAVGDGSPQLLAVKSNGTLFTRAFD